MRGCVTVPAPTRHSDTVVNLMLTWQQSAEVAGVAAVVGIGLRRSRSPKLATAAALVIETAIIAILYSVWQFVGDFSVMSTDRAFIRGEWIARFEHTLRLPSERSVQDLILNHAGLVQAANLYYDTMHFGVMFVFLLWMFVRHRDRYSAIRTTLAITTLACLAIQFVPVAPPRLLPGFIDTAAVYGQSVYAGGGLEGNLAAMPSIHVAWAVVIAWYTMRITRSRWRYLGPLHAVITVFVVVATGNHWWLDGIVAVAVLVLCAWLRYGVARGWSAFAQSRRTRATPVADPVADPAGEVVPADEDAEPARVT
jgi:hypothetical protein